jgi:outer membrane protein OmpA-like peptidoglycan-associated protein
MAMAAASMPPAPAVSAGTISIEFVTGSADLPPGANDLLKQLVARRGQAVIAVTGHGEAASNDPAAQSAALTLALARAQATAKALTGDGVPDAAVRVGAEAGGRGADARLIQ